MRQQLIRCDCCGKEIKNYKGYFLAIEPICSSLSVFAECLQTIGGTKKDICQECYDAMFRKIED